MPKVRFLQTRRVRDAEGAVYEEGKVYDLPRESCERWVRRGAAVHVAEKEKAESPEKAGPPPTKKEGDNSQTRSIDIPSPGRADRTKILKEHDAAK